ncbi:hypothetical protein ACHAWF_011144 [Thalassiosira exigua]
MAKFSRSSPPRHQPVGSSIVKHFLVFLVASVSIVFPTVRAKQSILMGVGVGGAAKKSSTPKKDDAYHLLARSIRERLNRPTDSDSSPTQYDVAAISSALRSLSTTQAALKKIDGTAHEMYQRTHKSSTSLDEDTDDVEGDEIGSGKIGGLKVAGRMSRNADRVGCIADALFAAELCELIKLAPPLGRGDEGNKNEDSAPEDFDENHIIYGEEGTLASWTGRKVVLNTTIHTEGASQDLAISVLVIYEQHYNGGAGIDHGGVDDLLSLAKEEIKEDDDDASQSNSTDDSQTTQPPRGRYLVVLSDHCSGQQPSSSSDLPSIISVLDTPPESLRLRQPPSKNGDGNRASVCGPLYQMAEKLLEVIEPVLLDNAKDTTGGGSSENDEDEDEDASDGNPQMAKPAIHFVGYSLAGGVAAMAASVLDGSLPLQRKSNGKNKGFASICGSGHGRTSAICLGPPPCFSTNLESHFITSVIHGDDVVCRTTHGTIDHLCDRTRRSIKGGLLGRSVGWMSEAVSLTVSGLKSGDGKGGRLTVPGNVYIVRPRRIGGGSSSIHEVGGRGSRESLRASILWQLNDVLLSKSLWSHHKLDAYIRSLDRVRLKGFVDANENDE